jgi:hypothetical protein
MTIEASLLNAFKNSLDEITPSLFLSDAFMTSAILSSTFFWTSNAFVSFPVVLNNLKKQCLEEINRFLVYFNSSEVMEPSPSSS